jgi:hypothetical protein
VWIDRKYGVQLGTWGLSGVRWQGRFAPPPGRAISASDKKRKRQKKER